MTRSSPQKKTCFRPRKLQVLILVLVSVAFITLVYFNNSWTSNLNNLFPNFEYGEKIGKYQKNLTSNFFVNNLTSDDEKRLVNLNDFGYKIKKETLCQNNSVLLLVVVSSAPANHLQRRVIRDTWGKPDKEVKTVFILGSTNDTNFDETLHIEDRNFHDIVQGNFLDSYKNMTYKSTMGLKYAIYNCPSAKFIMKCDDDVFVNMPSLKNFLKHDLNVTNSKNRIFCNVNYARTPIRDPTGPFRKWYVSYEEWPEENFPMYCSGWYSIMTLDLAFDIYKHAQNSTFFWIDDVFLTGTAARKVQELKYVDITKFTLVYTDFHKVLNGSLGDMPFLLGGLNMAPDEIQQLWEYVLSKPVRRSILNETDFNVMT